MWRSGGTWLWSALRRTPGLTCYCEPLHELLATLTPADAAGLGDDAAATLRHPEARYFDEYRLACAGGAPGFQARFAYRDFIMSANGQDAELAAWLHGLRDMAAPGRAMFKFCRGLLRAPWLRQTLPGLHLLLVRDPGAILASYRSLGGYFFAMHAEILRRNRHAPLLAPLAAALLPADADGEGFDSAFAVAATWTPADQADVVAAFWALNLAVAAPAVDAVIDYDRLVGDAAARAALMSRLADFAPGARLRPGPPPAPAAPLRPSDRCRLWVAAGLADAGLAPPPPVDLSPAAANFAAAVFQ